MSLRTSKEKGHKKMLVSDDPEPVEDAQHWLNCALLELPGKECAKGERVRRLVLAAIGLKYMARPGCLVLPLVRSDGQVESARKEGTSSGNASPG